MSLLINESPLQVLPSLAAQIGLNEAIILQQAHYWLGKTTYEFDNHKWFYKTYEDWQSEFPFWSNTTIRRTIQNLEKLGILLSTNKYNKLKFDKTKWYSINYELFNQLMSDSICSNCTEASSEESIPTDQIEQANNQKAIHRNTTESLNYCAPVFAFYEENGFGTISPFIAEKIIAWIDDLNDELVLEAMKLATLNNVRKWGYVEAILKNWQNENIRTVDEIKKKQKHFRKFKHAEPIPEWFYNRNQVDELQEPIDYEEERRKILEKLKGE